jgi:hypothetical protein
MQGFKRSCEVSTTATIQFRKPSQLDDFYWNSIFKLKQH